MTDKPNKDKEQKKRSTTYEKPLKIHGTFDEVMKALVKESKPKSDKKKPKG